MRELANKYLPDRDSVRKRLPDWASDLFPLSPKEKAADDSRIREENKVEEAWYQDKKMYETGQEIKNAVAEGKLAEIPRRNYYYQEESGKIKSAESAAQCPPERYCGAFVISKNVKGDYPPALSVEAAILLEALTLEFGRRLKNAGLIFTPEQGNLQINSLTRSAERQQELLEREGRPAAEAEASTHTKGGAFDIAYSTFGRPPEGKIKKIKRHLTGNEYVMKSSRILEEILSELQERGGFHFMKEKSQRVFHVAVRPDLTPDQVRENFALLVEHSLDKKG